MSSNKPFNSTLIRLLVVDSFGADGFPYRFRTEKIFEGSYTGSAQKLRTLYFHKNTRRYEWRTANGNAFQGKDIINGFQLQPNRWYYYRTGCQFGFLTSGTCVLFFSINEMGEVKQKRADEKNEGPF